MPSVVGAEDTAVNKWDKNPCPPSTVYLVTFFFTHGHVFGYLWSNELYAEAEAGMVLDT